MHRRSRPSPVVVPRTVVHLTSIHDPFDGRIFKQCQALAEAGFSVLLVAPYESDVYVDGVSIVGLPRSRTRMARFTVGMWRLLRRALVTRGDIYQIHDPELLLVAVALRLLRKTVVYDAHEDFPRAVLIKTWIPPLFRRPLAAAIGVLEVACARMMHAVIAATPAIQERFVHGTTVLVRNMPDLETFDCGDGPAYEDRQPIVFYAGIISEARGALHLIEALDRLPADSEARLVLAGTVWPEALETDLRKSPGWDRTDFRGWIDKESVRRELCRARIGIVTLLPTPSYLESYPTKLFEYLAAGLPAVCSDFPLWRELLAEANCALFVDPTDDLAIASAIDTLLRAPVEAKMMGDRGRALVTRKFNWAAEAGTVVRLYEDLVEKGGHHA